MNTGQKILVMLPTSLVIVLFFYFIINMKTISDEDIAVQVKNSEDSNAKTSSSSSLSSSISSSTTSQISSNDSIISSAQSGELVVSENRCRGCGRCTSIDPEHFEMAGRVAIVISQENLSSSNLKSAISSCPADAIELI
jgi:ferredoxin